MKKFLLSLAAVASALTMSATSYTVFDIANPGTWEGDGNGYTQTSAIGDGTVTISSAKGSSTTNLLSPDNNTYSWRVYKNSSITIETSGFEMKSMVITYDGSSYSNEMTLSSGWTGVLNGEVYTLNSNGQTSFTGTASNSQVRIKTIVISDEATEAPEPEEPSGDVGEIPEDAISVAKALEIINGGTASGTYVVKGYITAIDEISTSYGNATYDIADEVGGSPVLKIYRSYWLDGAKYTSTNLIQVGGLVAVEGELVLYNSTPEMTTGGKVIGYKAPTGEVNPTPDPDPTPDPTPGDGVYYFKSFTDNLDGWEKVNDTSVGDFAGWKINTNEPKCAIANSYYGSANHAANAKLQSTFNMKDWTNVSMSFEQGFGYYFPTSQNDYFRVYVISNGTTEYLNMANFPEAPASGNWTKEWATNTFDLSEYDGETITIGFEYNNPGGSQSMAWEIANFMLYDSTNTGVAAIEAENAAPVYYNLQGVRVNAPEKGLYIVVKGNKSSKVIF